MLGQHAIVEDGLVGEEWQVAEAGDRRDARRRAGGDDNATGANEDVARRDLARARKARRRGDDAHAEPLEALDRVKGCDGGDDARDMVQDGGEIDGRRRTAKPESRV